MFKNFFFLALICVLVSCQKNAVQLISNELISSNTSSTDLPDQEDLPSEVKDIIINGGVGHFGCEVSKVAALDGGGVLGSSLGAFAYPYTSDMTPVKLYNSWLPCRPDIPFFIFSYVDSAGEIKNSSDHSVTFHLVLNPSYFNQVKVVGVNWGLNGQSDSASIQTFTMNGLQIGESNSVTCEVFSTDNNIAVYLQELAFDFEILLSLEDGPVVDFGAASTYACTNTGTFPIIAP